MKLITTIDLLKYHIEQMENELKEHLDFESKSEMNDYHRDLFVHLISIKTIIEEEFKI